LLEICYGSSRSLELPVSKVEEFVRIGVEKPLVRRAVAEEARVLGHVLVVGERGVAELRPEERPFVPHHNALGLPVLQDGAEAVIPVINVEAVDPKHAMVDDPLDQQPDKSLLDGDLLGEE